MFHYFPSYFVFVCILKTCIPAQGQVVRYKAELYGYPDTSLIKHGIGGGIIACKCGHLKTVGTEINSTIMHDIIKGNVEIESCSSVFPQGVCYLLSSCKSCTLKSQICEKVRNGKRKNQTSLKCNKEFYELDKDYFKIQDPMNSTYDHYNKHRVERAIKACGFPRNLRTADISCVTSDFSVDCVQKCIHGYTLPEGKSKKMKCMKVQKDSVLGKSESFSFRECEPFIDCTMHLVFPGSFDCYTATTHSPAMCHAKCSRYEDKPAVPRRVYECREEKGWGKDLPFCVANGSGMQLVHRD